MSLIIILIVSCHEVLILVLPLPPRPALSYRVTFRAGLGLLPASQRTAVDAYVGEVEQAAAQLRRFLYRTQGTGLAGGAAIAAAAEAQTWTVKQFRVRGDASFAFSFRFKAAGIEVRAQDNYLVLLPPPPPPPLFSPRATNLEPHKVSLDRR